MASAEAKLPGYAIPAALVDTCMNILKKISIKLRQKWTIGMQNKSYAFMFYRFPLTASSTPRCAGKVFFTASHVFQSGDRCQAIYQ